MAASELTKLLETAAPSPRAPLDIREIERRTHQRRRGRRIASSAASVLIVGSLIGLAVQLPYRRGHDTVVAGPAASRRIPVELHGEHATTELRLLDGTRLRLTLPRALAQELARLTFADLELHGSLSAGPRHGWRIDVSVGTIKSLIPRGEPLAVPSSSRASAAVVDPTSRRLGLQFRSWALVASGDSMSDADIDALLAGVALLETPDGFVEYRGSFPLRIVDAPDVAASDRAAGISVFMGDSCPWTTASRRTAQGLDSYRIENRGFSGGVVELCDRANHLRIDLRAAGPLTDQELDAVRLEVLSVGGTLAALQRGEHP